MPSPAAHVLSSTGLYSKRTITLPDVSTGLNKTTFQVPTLLAFAAIVAIMVIVGVRVLNVPVVPMCLLVIIEAVIAVMLHHVELWVHGLLILAELCAGVAGEKTVLIILCAVVYIAATFALQMLDKGETQNGQ